MTINTLHIAPFEPKDQAAAKALILAGLAEHWGHLDPTKNPDLNDIASNYADGLFLLAWQNAKLVGTGAFLPRAENTVEIMRMSVAKTHRRQGIGAILLQALCQAAKAQGYQQIILETTHTWEPAITFYQEFGFEMTHRVDDDIYFMFQLKPQSTRLV